VLDSVICDWLELPPLGPLRAPEQEQSFLQKPEVLHQVLLGNSNWPEFSLLTHTMVGASPSMMDHLPHFLNAKYFNDRRKFRVQDARITLLKTSNLEQRECRQQLERKSANYPLAIIYSRVKF
jgi:hypothetical protein